jgi:chromosome segregation ATPase
MQISDNSTPQTLATSAKNSKLSKTPKNSKPSKVKITKASKVKITKATEEQIKKAPKITIDSETESEEEEKKDEDEEQEQFLEPSDDWDYCDFENRYREILFYYKSLKEENQGANEEIKDLRNRLKDSKEEIESIEEQRDEARQKALELLEICKYKDDEITSLKFQLERASADALKLNTAVINLEKEIKILKDNEDDEETREGQIEMYKIALRNLKRKYRQEQDDNQELIKERDDLQFKNDTLQLTIDNLNTELKDLKIYSNDNEENFFKVNEENKELQDTITGLELEKEIICKQNEELSEKVKYFRQETLNQAKRRMDVIAGFEGEIRELKIAFREKSDIIADMDYQLRFYLLTSKEIHSEINFDFRQLIIKLEHHMLEKFMYRDRSEKLTKELEELKKSKL